ncbi:MAG: hypothetical protein ACLUEV_08705 [Alistipes sp.]
MTFSTEYLKLSKNSYVADELELSYFNATLGVSWATRSSST